MGRRSKRKVTKLNSKGSKMPTYSIITETVSSFTTEGPSECIPDNVVVSTELFKTTAWHVTVQLWMRWKNLTWCLSFRNWGGFLEPLQPMDEVTTLPIGPHLPSWILPWFCSHHSQSTPNPEEKNIDLRSWWTFVATMVPLSPSIFDIGCSGCGPLIPFSPPSDIPLLWSPIPHVLPGIQWGTHHLLNQHNSMGWGEGDWKHALGVRGTPMLMGFCCVVLYWL